MTTDEILENCGVTMGPGPLQRAPLQVVCGFPGVGKSSACKVNPGWHDSDSSKFSKLPTGERHPEWPGNYIEHIRGLTGVALVSTHKEVRDALAEAGIPFAVVYPVHDDARGEYLRRYMDRGSPQGFIDRLCANWDNWIQEMLEESRAVRRFLLMAGQYLQDVAHMIDGTVACPFSVFQWRSQFYTEYAGQSDEDRKLEEWVCPFAQLSDKYENNLREWEYANWDERRRWVRLYDSAAWSMLVALAAREGIREPALRAALVRYNTKRHYRPDFACSVDMV